MDSPSLPLRSAVLALIGVQSAYTLFARDVPFLVAGQPDIIGTAIDAGFFGYSLKTLVVQAGLAAAPEPAAVASLTGLECSLTLNIGREPGTWMPQEWAASGARLSLPLVVKLTDEPLDLGFPGEEAMGGRAVRRLEVCEVGSFVGPNGVVNVQATGGAWSATPSGTPGASQLRFYIDFPEEARRNDVSLPAGRVFFSCACLDAEVRASLVPGDKNYELASQLPPDIVEAWPGGALLTRDGGLTIKRNGLRNLWGAFGDVFFILGKFAVTGVQRPGESGAVGEPMAEAAM